MFWKLKFSHGQNFWPWQECMSTLLDMYGVAFAFTTSKADSSTFVKHIKEWTHANKVCRHTLFSVFSNNLFDVYYPY